MRRPQIGVIGSCSDLQYTREAVHFAVELGKLIAKSKATLVFGAEKDIDSLPTIAAKAAKATGGETIGITYEKGLQVWDEDAATVVVASGLVRGGGRETTLVLSCDAVIALSGGSGTLNELCIAYQADTPAVVVAGFGGWADKLAGTYLDERRRYKFLSAKTPEKALVLALQAVKRRA